jgi:hypothetical protein
MSTAHQALQQRSTLSRCARFGFIVTSTHHFILVNALLVTQVPVERNVSRMMVLDQYGPVLATPLHATNPHAMGVVRVQLSFGFASPKDEGASVDRMMQYRQYRSVADLGPDNPASLYPTHRER